LNVVLLLFLLFLLFLLPLLPLLLLLLLLLLPMHLRLPRSLLRMPTILHLEATQRFYALACLR
jgi:hypothetical protein